MNTLEVMRTVEARLEGGEPYEYTSWSKCCCGHIYSAAVGSDAKDASPESLARVPEFAENIVTVARALGWNGTPRSAFTAAETATMYVSNKVLSFEPVEYPDEEAPKVERAAALKAVRRAIAALEAEQERNRLDVLAQTKDIIDNAAPVEATT